VDQKKNVFCGLQENIEKQGHNSREMKKKWDTNAV